MLACLFVYEPYAFMSELYESFGKIFRDGFVVITVHHYRCTRSVQQKGYFSDILLNKYKNNNNSKYEQSDCLTRLTNIESDQSIVSLFPSSHIPIPNISRLKECRPALVRV